MASGGRNELSMMTSITDSRPPGRRSRCWLCHWLWLYWCNWLRLYLNFWPWKKGILRLYICLECHIRSPPKFKPKKPEAHKLLLAPDHKQWHVHRQVPTIWSKAQMISTISQLRFLCACAGQGPAVAPAPSRNSQEIDMDLRRWWVWGR